jgi:hypothetical protein
MLKDIVVIRATSTLEMYMWSKKKRLRLVTKHKLPLVSSATSTFTKRLIIILKVLKWFNLQDPIFSKNVKHGMMTMMCVNLDIMMNVAIDVKSLILLLA